MDRLQTLKIFLAVAEAESFAAGARAVGLSAPSATRGINALETELGVRLFTRTTRRVRLTDVGRDYLGEIRDILGRLEQADAAAAGAGETPKGHLRLTCPQEFGRIYIAPLLREFLDRYPEVSADVLMVDRVVNIVEEGFDMALRIGHLPDSGLAAVRAGQVRRVICAAPAYLELHGTPRTPEDLVHHRMISTAPLASGPTWRFGAKNAQTLRVPARLSLSSVAATIDAARAGWGLARVLSYQVGPDVAAGRLLILLQDHEPEPFPIHLVHVEGRRAAAKVRSFIDFAAPRLLQEPILSPGLSHGATVA